MYVPIFKNRLYENKLLNDYGYLFKNDKIMPLIEIINISKNSLKETLLDYEKEIKSNFFIDFFTFNDLEYRPYTREMVEFPIAIRDESNYRYFDDLLAKTIKSEKAIPVIAIKTARNFLLEKRKIREIITLLQKEKQSVAVRLEGKLFDDYFVLINQLLRADDYFLLDISENSLSSYVFQLADFKKLKKSSYKALLLNSPRKREFYNGSYEKEEYTKLINNNVFKEYQKYDFVGFGDYLGLKDELPRKSGSGQGCAHTLFYNRFNNQFYSALNPVLEEGIRGFKNVIRQLYQKKEELDRDNDCLAYKFIDKLMIKRNTSSNWATWKYVLMLRTLSEMRKVYY
ncbi:MAG: hypothetical protein M0R46_17285 [Candidatus Muirbacterium halophilum]|nr:hypothetical protein [Acholeplasmataceae bacterium]MCK9477673.1 hypothetical protein [Candidatus Muirbacterium halophilum]MDD4090081.1 hypothetical protein [Acholeplasmataceae bacterium]